ncbi:hypothetical protein [Bacillus phage SBSphiJ4]|nr:hypothetical protein [Bacillus phage SBSphiJ4]
MGRLSYRIEEGRNCGTRKETRYLIYVDGIEYWKLPQLHRIKLLDGCYRLWSNDPAEQVLNEFIAIYGDELEEKLF